MVLNRDLHWLQDSQHAHICGYRDFRAARRRGSSTAGAVATSSGIFGSSHRLFLSKVEGKLYTSRVCQRQPHIALLWFFKYLPMRAWTPSLIAVYNYMVSFIKPLTCSWSGCVQSLAFLEHLVDNYEVTSQNISKLNNTFLPLQVK